MSSTSKQQEDQSKAREQAAQERPKSAEPAGAATSAETEPKTEPASAQTPEAAGAGQREDIAKTAAEADRLKQELEAAKDQMLRAHAELENFRKRTYRQMEEERKYAALPLVRDLVPVLDNLERAIEASEQNHDTASLLEGVKMVAQQFAAVLEQHHCKRINAQGAAFDPHRHEAIAQKPSADHPAGTVLDVAQVGYELHDRVVRPARVVVATSPAGDGSEAAGEGDAS